MHFQINNFKKNWQFIRRYINFHVTGKVKLYSHLDDFFMVVQFKTDLAIKSFTLIETIVEVL